MVVLRLKREFAFFDLADEVVGDKLNQEELNVLVASLVAHCSELFKDNIDLENFIKFYNQKYFVSGKTYIDFFDEENRFEGTVRKSQIALIELIPIPNNNEECRYRILTPEELFLNRKNLDLDDWVVFDYRKPVRKNEFYNRRTQYKKKSFNRNDLSKDRWLTDKPVRSLRYKHAFKLSDDKFYLGNDEPTIRRKLKTRTNEIDPWNDKNISNKANWKTISKDKFQWEHNLK